MSISIRTSASVSAAAAQAGRQAGARFPALAAAGLALSSFPRPCTSFEALDSPPLLAQLRHAKTTVPSSAAAPSGAPTTSPRLVGPGEGEGRLEGADEMNEVLSSDPIPTVPSDAPSPATVGEFCDGAAASTVTKTDASRIFTESHGALRKTEEILKMLISKGFCTKKRSR